MLDRKILKFGIAGFLNTAVDWTLYFILTNYFLQAAIHGKIIAAAGGVTSAFILNAVWVFRDSFFSKYNTCKTIPDKFYYVFIKYLKTVASYTIGMFINVIIFSLCLSVGCNELFSLAIATAFSFITNFILSQYYVFCKEAN